MTEYNMSIEEAISCLEFDMSMITFDPNTGEELDLETVKIRNEMNYKCYFADKLAIEALKKQLPLELEYHNCPSCGIYNPPSHTYCSHCGQKLK